ncbi:biotin--[acetyl-CoA-carboxylase] ligase [Rickettsia endosymbiont of Oedothorax gibbosus]|uniref:biotin--[acetyl-CoA-carboxylase] ligase n=1 Tax=Rickettsia endosymbiont of Oedothorax gibbosus TaxID=931099 RepID=UPI0024E166D0|nr:biotin--[acetyl-CoA-carboxylase] ligase [Rickettsia endosymbiont of Oedothorax gibbosus]
MSWQKKYKLLVFDTIDSTSCEAIRMAKSCPDCSYVILAKNQTKSRGRNNKIWHSNLGNLHVSILLKHQINLSYLPQLSFVMAIVVYKTITSLTASSVNSIKLKWPNDILINGKKVSGILLESISINNNNYIIISIGINIKESPLNIQQLATNLSDENIEVKDTGYLLDILMINFEKYFSRWKEQGFSKIRQYWLRNAYKLGEMVSVNDGNTKILGIFKDIDENGGIRIQLEDGKIVTLCSFEILNFLPIVNPTSHCEA